MRILAGDVGGTHSRFAIVDVDYDRYENVYACTLESGDYATFNAALFEFMDRAGSGSGVQSAGFSLAGPVRNATASLTNLSWKVDARQIANDLKIPSAYLINDFEAVGRGLARTEDKHIQTLQKGVSSPRQLRALIGAGTGLGQALMTWNGHDYEVHPTEGGHVDFAPRDHTEIALLSALLSEFQHVSIERLLSGSGLIRIYDFLLNYRKQTTTGALADAFKSSDRAECISRFGIGEKDALCTQALDLFISLYGAQAGNLALTCLPRGGLYVAGGIIGKILPRVMGGGFLEAFLNKGRMRGLLEEIPVHIVLDRDIGIRGAALTAWHNASQTKTVALS